MWDEWKQGKIKELKQMHDTGMCGKPIDPPKNVIFLRTYWQYSININGTIRYRQCYDGSKIASTILRELNLTYSTCVEHPLQRLFLAIDFHLDPHIYGGYVSDVFLHIPVPYVPTFVSIDEQFSDWYRHKFGKNIVKDKVIYVLTSLKGHLDSVRLWEYLINHILK